MLDYKATYLCVAMATVMIDIDLSLFHIVPSVYGYHAVAMGYRLVSIVIEPGTTTDT
jgi:hypothetical protein